MTPRRCALVAAFLIGALFGPGACLRRDGALLYDGDFDLQRAHANGVVRWTEAPLDESDFGTGSHRFDGEWLFATYVMGAIGHAQVALEHPEYREEAVSRMEAALDAVERPEVRAFDRDAWGHDPLRDIGSPRAHVAFLGYYDLALALHVHLDPSSRFAERERRITAHLARLLAESPTGLLETYPGEVYPVDNAAFIAALGVHDRATGESHETLIARFADDVRARYLDPETGLLYQRVHARTGRPVDGARGSGTALASYFLSYADRELSAGLYAAMQAHLLRHGLGFAGMREHAFGGDFSGDVDSGPVLFGLSVSATGFGIGAARAHGDEDGFGGLYATAAFFGAPVDQGDARMFALGGPIGDALMFAMTTAPRRGALW
jgi:hypothetical protein